MRTILTSHLKESGYSNNHRRSDNSAGNSFCQQKFLAQDESIFTERELRNGLRVRRENKRNFAAKKGFAKN
jgi:hypothetical protein